MKNLELVIWLLKWAIVSPNYKKIKVSTDKSPNQFICEFRIKKLRFLNSLNISKTVSYSVLLIYFDTNMAQYFN